VLKVASVDNKLRAPHGTTQLRAGYTDLSAGASVEIGQRCALQGDWFIEPQLQLSYLHIFTGDYTAAPLTPGAPLRIGAQDLDALQIRLGNRFGKTIRLAHGGVLQPYARLGGAVLNSNGGEIRNRDRDQRLRPNIDGARAEAAAGVVWQLAASHQLHFDYEASYAENYTKPWGLTAGYRWQF
jgi:outer membrane autotransporter protein